jgi:mannose-6-phosphate isomerase-like protein (cupin superfamily)
MVDPELVLAPLLNAALGTQDNQFVIHENREDARRLPRRGVPLHLHRSEDEAWYVLEGTLRFQFGKKEFEAGPGSGVLLPRGTAHTFWNPGPDPTRYLLVVGPKTEGLLQVIHGPRSVNSAQLHAIYDSFDVELLE